VIAMRMILWRLCTMVSFGSYGTRRFHRPTNLSISLTSDSLLKRRVLCFLLPFSTTHVGTTNYLNVDSDHRRLEIGGTWYRKNVQRSHVNTQCKLLLLDHAFETLGCIAVEFRTHFFNYQSRRGIERLGAKLDGILRSHQIADNGTLRDTCVYSIIASEWPTVKAHLTWQMEKPRQSKFQ